MFPALELFLRRVEKEIIPIVEIIAPCSDLPGHPEKFDLNREVYLSVVFQNDRIVSS